MKYILLALCLSCGLTGSAQTVWCPTGALWHYDYVNLGITGHIQIEYIGDSLIAGKNCKVLEKSYHLYYYSTETIDEWVFDTAYTYASNDTVFHLRKDGQFYVLYDFSAAASDNWQVDQDSTLCINNTATVTVDSVGTMNINTFTLPWVWVTEDPTSYRSMNGRIIERIGCHDAYMFPDVNCIGDGHEGGMFRCYYDDVFGLYKRPGSEDCDFIINLGLDHINVELLQIFPNPVSASLNILLRVEGEVKILDNKGGVVYSEMFRETGDQQIDVSGFAIGGYILQFETSGGRVVKKFHIQR
jgi:hypothetical protein